MRAFRNHDQCLRPRVLWGLMTAVLALGAAGCAGSAQPQGQDGTPPEVAAADDRPARTAPTETEWDLATEEPAARAADAEAAGSEAPEELSPTIYYDDEGRAYRRLRIPKEEGRFRRMDDNRLQIPYGLLFYIDEEVADAFYVKLFVSPADLEGAEIPAPPTPSPAETETRVATAPLLVTPDAVDRLRFEPFDRGLPDQGQWRNGFDIADVDGDGYLDIAHGPPRKGRQIPHVFLGDGSGGWRLWQQVSFPGAALDYGDAEVADFNGDGIADMAFAVHLRGIAIFVGDGEGGFELWSEGIEFADPKSNQGTAEFSSRAITSLDWNGDGRIDLLALGEGPSLGRPTAGLETSPGFQAGSRGPVVFLNQGDGSWQRHVPSSEGRLPFGDAIVVGDFDGDGRSDFATATNGYGAVGIIYLARPDGSWHREEVDALGPYTLLKNAAVADFDGDGRAELAGGTLSFAEGDGFVSAVELFDRGADGTWTRETLVSVESQLGVWAVGAGDLDADGRSDIVAVTGAGDVWTLLGADGGGFLLEESGEIEPPGYLCRGYHVELADLDGQPGDEVVVGFAGEPGSEQMIPGLRRQCPDEGALQAWKAVQAQ